jgi:hypothetical protein
MRHLILTLALLLVLPGFGSGFGPGSATAGEGPDFNDRPSVGHPLRFTDARGNVFRPRTLIVLIRSGTLAAPLPATTDNATSEDHLDLSGTPLVGQFFRRRLAPSDAAREAAMAPSATMSGGSTSPPAPRPAVMELRRAPPILSMAPWFWRAPRAAP